jgi:hypothetical protein
MPEQGFVAFHGTDGDSCLAIFRSRVLRPKNGVVFLGLTASETYLHGADRRRARAFSLELRVFADAALVRRVATFGIPITVRIETTHEIRVEVISLRARTRVGDGRWLEKAIPPGQIERYLEGERT